MTYVNQYSWRIHGAAIYDGNMDPINIAQSC